MQGASAPFHWLHGFVLAEPSGLWGSETSMQPDWVDPRPMPLRPSRASKRSGIPLSSSSRSAVLCRLSFSLICFQLISSKVERAIEVDLFVCPQKSQNTCASLRDRICGLPTPPFWVTGEKTGQDGSCRNVLRRVVWSQFPNFFSLGFPGKSHTTKQIVMLHIIYPWLAKQTISLPCSLLLSHFSFQTKATRQKIK